MSFVSLGSAVSPSFPGVSSLDESQAVEGLSLKGLLAVLSIR